MSNSTTSRQDTDSVVDSKEVPLSDDEISHLTRSVLPKTNRNFFLLCLIYLAMLPILPYFPARITHRTLIERMDYWSAIELCCWSFGLFLCLLYYIAVVRLKQDIRGGKKRIYRTPIINKRWKGTKKIEILIGHRPPGLAEKIILDSKEYYNWLKGDILEIEYLAKSGQLIRYSKVEDTNNRTLEAAR